MSTKKKYKLFSLSCDYLRFNIFERTRLDLENQQLTDHTLSNCSIFRDLVAGLSDNSPQKLVNFCDDQYDVSLVGDKVFTVLFQVDGVSLFRVREMGKDLFGSGDYRIDFYGSFFLEEHSERLSSCLAFFSQNYQNIVQRIDVRADFDFTCMELFKAGYASRYQKFDFYGQEVGSNGKICNFQTMYFGKKSSYNDKTLLRIYNKKLDLTDKKGVKLYNHKYHRFLIEQPVVTRVEVEVRNKSLRTYKINTLNDFLALDLSNFLKKFVFNTNATYLKILNKVDFEPFCKSKDLEISAVDGYYVDLLYVKKFKTMSDKIILSGFPSHELFWKMHYSFRIHYLLKKYEVLAPV